MTWAKVYGAGSSSVSAFRWLAWGALANALYVVGDYTGNATFDSFTLTSQGGSDIMVLRLTSGGTVDAAVTYGGADNDYGSTVAVDSTGSVVAGGSFTSASIAFGSYTVYNQGGDADIWLVKLSSSLSVEPLWATSYGGPGTTGVGDLAVGIDNTGTHTRPLALRRPALDFEAVVLCSHPNSSGR